MRRNRTLLDTVRSIRSLANLLVSFWGYPLETAIFTLNRTPSKAVDKSPFLVFLFYVFGVAKLRYHVYKQINLLPKQTNVSSEVILKKHGYIDHAIGLQ